jgi:hypothetical protein
VERKTKETQVEVKINIDGTGKCEANTPVHFLNHMLDVSASRFSRRSCFRCFAFVVGISLVEICLEICMFYHMPQAQA